MEYFDIVDDNGIPTGKTIERSIAHSDGTLHRTAHIWVIRKVKDRYQVLLQKRSAIKDSFPGCYDTSSAGHITAGDEPLISAIREIGEELGIQADASTLHFAGTFPIEYKRVFHGKPFLDKEVSFVYVYTEPVELSELKLQVEEVESVDWFDLLDTYDRCSNHDPKFCVPIAGLDVLRRYLGIEESTIIE